MIINKDLNIIGAKLVGDPIQIKHWNYFPHVTSDIRGFYSRLQANQGADGIETQHR